MQAVCRSHLGSRTCGTERAPSIQAEFPVDNQPPSSSLQFTRQSDKPVLMLALQSFENPVLDQSCADAGLDFLGDHQAAAVLWNDFPAVETAPAHDLCGVPAEIDERLVDEDARLDRHAECVPDELTAWAQHGLRADNLHIACVRIPLRPMSRVDQLVPDGVGGRWNQQFVVAVNWMFGRVDVVRPLDMVLMHEQWSV